MPSARARRTACPRRSRARASSSTRCSGRVGAMPKPQLPVTTVVTPCQDDGVSVGVPEELGVVVGVGIDEARARAPGRRDRSSGASVANPGVVDRLDHPVGHERRRPRRSSAPVPSTTRAPRSTNLRMSLPLGKLTLVSLPRGRRAWPTDDHPVEPTEADLDRALRHAQELGPVGRRRRGRRAQPPDRGPPGPRRGARARRRDDQPGPRPAVAAVGRDAVPGAPPHARLAATRSMPTASPATRRAATTSAPRCTGSASPTSTRSRTCSCGARCTTAGPRARSAAPARVRNTVMTLSDGLVGRGVLLDIPRAARRRVPRPAETAITVADLEAAEAAARASTVGPGDFLMVSTGRDARRRGAARSARPDRRRPGRADSVVPALAARARRRRCSAATASPTACRSARSRTGRSRSTRSASPRSGLHLIDNMHLEPLAMACAERKRWEVLLTVNPLRIPGGTGCPVNPIASL